MDPLQFLVQEALLQMKHVIDGVDLSLEQVLQPPVPETTPTLPLVSDGGTIVVRGFQHPIHQEMVDLYFTNASKSGGGEITDIVMREKEVYIVFTDQAGIPMSFVFVLRLYRIGAFIFILAAVGISDSFTKTLSLLNLSKLL